MFDGQHKKKKKFKSNYCLLFLFDQIVILALVILLLARFHK